MQTHLFDTKSGLTQESSLWQFQGTRKAKMPIQLGDLLSPQVRRIYNQKVALLNPDSMYEVFDTDGTTKRKNN